MCKYNKKILICKKNLKNYSDDSNSDTLFDKSLIKSTNVPERFPYSSHIKESPIAPDPSAFKINGPFLIVTFSLKNAPTPE